MRELDLVIKESLRLMPPVPGLPRRAVRDTEILGHYIPAGTPIDCAYTVNHFLPELWTRPEVFDPERFGEARREDKSHRLAWVPFGAGAHKCIGMHFGTFEVKTIIAALVRDYEWELPGITECRGDSRRFRSPGMVRLCLCAVAIACGSLDRSAQRPLNRSSATLVSVAAPSV